MVERCVIALAWTFILTASLSAAEPSQQNNTNAVWFESWFGLSNAQLHVAFPNGESADIFASTGTPVFQLSGSEIVDGVYRYELRAIVDDPDQNQAASGDKDVESYYRTGFFVVERGAIIRPIVEEEEIDKD